MGVKVTSVGECTTPQLHWLVAKNMSDKKAYIKYFKDSFLDFLNLVDQQNEGAAAKKNYQKKLVVDCANGVGAQCLNMLKDQPDFAERVQM